MRISHAALLLLLLAGCAAGERARSEAFRASSTALHALHDRPQLPLLRPGTKSAAFSSFDRSGANDDGFLGTYSALRIENGDSVIAEMTGPGVIQRIWTTHSEKTRDGLLAHAHEHIRIYIDGGEKPVLDVPFEALFDGSLPQFPQPLAGRALGGFYSYVPIGYLESCKVVIEGSAVRFYQIDYASMVDADGITPFSMRMNADEKDDLARAVELWNDPLQVTRAAGVERFVASSSAASSTIEAGSTEDQPRLVLGVSFDGELGDGEIEVQGAGDGSTQLRLPLAMFFAAAFQADPFDSLLLGRRGTLYYNLFPFYTRGAFSYVVRPGKDTHGTLTAYATAIDEVPAGAARLSAQLNRSQPTLLGSPHPLLHAEGQGHYLGTYLATEGPPGLPGWLEGDDTWILDGNLAMHGTGTEDYFNCGWYDVDGRLDGPGASPSHGFPIYGMGDDERMRAAAYRWHFSDPVNFEASIDVEIEHGDENSVDADYQSVAWYYVR